MKIHFNRKYSVCKICKKPHYAFNLCRSHYNKFKRHSPLKDLICKWKGCKTKVYSHTKEQICGLHWTSYLISKNPLFSKDGGKFGYKDYRNIQKLKKCNCENCNSNLNLIIHHIDKNTRNSKPQNLITLCNKCHLKLHPKTHYFKYSKYYSKFGKSFSQIAKDNNISRSHCYKIFKLFGQVNKNVLKEYSKKQRESSL